jgi:hypothetical protein
MATMLSLPAYTLIIFSRLPVSALFILTLSYILTFSFSIKAILLLPAEAPCEIGSISFFDSFLVVSLYAKGEILVSFNSFK